MSHSVIDRELLIRGAFIAFIDLCIFSLASGQVLLQVLYAIGIQHDADGSIAAAGATCGSFSGDRYTCGQ